MRRLQTKKNHSHQTTRRGFLQASAVSAGGLSLSTVFDGPASASTAHGEKRCILLFLVGGPSQLETWDPKPQAPESIRGPFGTIRTSVAGLHLSEHFPRMASRADQFAVVRSVFHKEAAVHETGHQLMQTGRLCVDREYPHYGAVLSRLHGRRNGLPASVILPNRIGNTGVNVSHGQTAGFLGRDHEPFVLDEHQNARPRRRNELLDFADHARLSNVGDVFTSRMREPLDLDRESIKTRRRYGAHEFGQSCLRARRLVEQGVRLVTVNMFDSVFDKLTWDCHANGSSLPTTFDDYREVLCPMFDQAYTALLDDLTQRGMLRDTLVVAMGEFGRTPQINSTGGRDHWPGVWSILFAGGGVHGGQVVGASDRIASEPRKRPVTPAEVAATIYQSLGVNPSTALRDSDGVDVVLAEAQPIHELFA